MMAVDEQTRHEMQRRFTEVVGVETAGALMEHLPPSGWGDVVTREYLDLALDAQNARVDTRFERLEGSINTRFGAVDERFERLEGSVNTRFAEVDGRFDRLESQLDAVRNEVPAAVRGELVAAVSQQTRQTIFAMIGTVLSLAALAQFI